MFKSNIQDFIKNNGEPKEWQQIPSPNLGSSIPKEPKVHRAQEGELKLPTEYLRVSASLNNADNIFIKVLLFLLFHPYLHLLMMPRLLHPPLISENNLDVMKISYLPHRFSQAIEAHDVIRGWYCLAAGRQSLELLEDQFGTEVHLQ